jgi:hypothetical protein
VQSCSCKEVDVEFSLHALLALIWDYIVMYRECGVPILMYYGWTDLK